jgi:chloramphenicol O-acetyltransferase type A
LKHIDLNTWKRKGHFEFFYRMDYPQYNICMNLDVTRFLKFTRDNNLSFYYSMIFAATSALNSTEAFRYRIREGKIVLHDRVHPSFTDMDQDDDLFKLIRLDITDDLFSFVKAATMISDRQKEYFLPEHLSGRDDVVYITCIPWISFTHVSHTIALNRDDSVPRISWGKYFPDNGKMLLPFSVQVNHALVDGIHVGRYVDALQTQINDMH